MIQWLLKENTLEVLRKTALSLVKARREEGKLTKVSELEDPHLLAYEGFIQNSGNPKKSPLPLAAILVHVLGAMASEPTSDTIRFFFYC